MQKCQWVAVGWSVLNIFLATLVPVPPPFPWMAVVLFASLPLLMLFFAEPIAAKLRRGLMERFASDRDKPQSPLVIMFMAWMVLALQTVFLAVRLA